MLTKIEMAEWESAIRRRLVARKEQLGMSDAELGNIAFSGISAIPKGKIQSLLNGQGAGKDRKPQNIRAADLMNLCEALRLSFYDVMNEARVEIKEKKS